MIDKFKKLWNKWVNPDKLATPAEGGAKFELRYAKMIVGKLSLCEGRWMFEYTDEFRASDLRPLVQFPDTLKRYESAELWPFFGLRIPSLSQPFVQSVIKSEHLDAADQVELLRRFGRRTIANPYELVG